MNTTAAPGKGGKDRWKARRSGVGYMTAVHDDVRAQLPVDEAVVDCAGATVDEGVAVAETAEAGIPSLLFFLGCVFGRCARTMAPIVVGDVLALSLAGAVTQAWLSAAWPVAAASVGWRAAPLALLPLVVVYWLNELYAEVWTHVVIEFRQLTRSTAAALAAAVTAAAVTSPPLALWLLVACPTVIVLVPLLRATVHAWCSGQKWWGFPTLVVGSGSEAEAVARALLATPRSGLRPVMLTDPSGRCRSSVVPVVNEPGALGSTLRRQAIRHAVVSLPELCDRRLGEALNGYSRLIPHLLVLSDCSTLPTLWGAARTGGRLSGLEVRNGLLLVTLQALKRIVDVGVASVSLILGAPVLALTALLVKFTSGGPVLYAHTRIGRRGRLFRAWKFRTMHVDGDAILRRHFCLNPAARQEWDREQKLHDDPRITRIGRLLRRTSIDELPQLWNVLIGEMSLVGPRPIVQSEIRRYGKVFGVYTAVKPGITGLWQVSGRNSLGYEERVQLDEFYIRHWSLWLDTYIAAKTLVALLSRRGAY